MGCPYEETDLERYAYMAPETLDTHLLDKGSSFYSSKKNNLYVTIPDHKYIFQSSAKGIKVSHKGQKCAKVPRATNFVGAFVDFCDKSPSHKGAYKRSRINNKGVLEAQVEGNEWAHGRATIYQKTGQTTGEKVPDMGAIDLVVVSPLTRTLETCTNLFFIPKDAETQREVQKRISSELGGGLTKEWEGPKELGVEVKGNDRPSEEEALEKLVEKGF